MSRHHPYGGYDGASRRGGAARGSSGSVGGAEQGPGPNRDYPRAAPAGGGGEHRSGAAGRPGQSPALPHALNLAADMFGGRPPMQQQQQQCGSAPPPQLSPGAYGAPSAGAYGAPPGSAGSSAGAGGGGGAYGPGSGAAPYPGSADAYAAMPPQGYAPPQQRPPYAAGAGAYAERPPYSPGHARPPPPPHHQSPPQQHQGSQPYGAAAAAAPYGAPLPGNYGPPPAAGGAPPYGPPAGGAGPPFGNYAPVESVPHGEERPQRILFVRNIDYNAERGELRRAFDDVGEVKKMHDAPKKRGMVFVTYYDLRAAEAAIAKLKGFLVNGRPIDVHYCLPRDSDMNRPCDRDRDQGTLVVGVRNAQFPATEATIATKFGEYGELQSVRVGKMPTEFIVQYWDSRAAEMAFDRMNKRPFQGGEVQIKFDWDQPRVPGEARMAHEMRKAAYQAQVAAAAAPPMRGGPPPDMYGAAPGQAYARPPPGNGGEYGRPPLPPAGYGRPPVPQREAGGPPMRAWGQAATGNSARPPPLQAASYGAGSPSHAAGPGGYTHGPPASAPPYAGSPYNGAPPPQQQQGWGTPQHQQQQQQQQAKPHSSPPVDHSRLDQAQKIQLLLASLKNGAQPASAASPNVQAATPAAPASAPAGLPANIAALLAQAQAPAQGSPPAQNAASLQQQQQQQQQQQRNGPPPNNGSGGAQGAKPNDVSNLLALIGKR